MNNAVNVSRAGRGTGPIFDWRVDRFVRSLSVSELTKLGEWNINCRNEFTDMYRNWLQSSTESPVIGLDQFSQTYFVNGVTQAYDIFFFRYKDRRFRTLPGEYPYVRLSMDSWSVLNDDLEIGDALVLSCPFYIDGGVPKEYYNLLDQCLDLNIPVFIDAAYFGTCYGVNFDFSHPAITMIGFSLSKPFSVQSFRIGILFAKFKLNFLEEIQVDSNYFNKIGAAMGMRLMDKFSPDFIPQEYKDRHQDMCRELEVLPSYSVMLANIKDSDRRFDKILEDKRFEREELPNGYLRRVCISDYLRRDTPLVQKIMNKALLD